ncbi:hypothetical protein [Virgibacillus subterraneus]|uniref:hypothetical protein n=1 Tax=Virgibacillus subterraneus TaxID=621109 RepID=UPI000B81C924|nr:hypothetical protein [Virgibacillus subterraneus]
MTDFEKFAEQNPKFSFVPVMMKADSDEWGGENGYIDAKLLKRYVSDVSKPIYYLTRPAGMVMAMYDMFVEEGANADDIRAEEFSGYRWLLIT